MTEKAEDFVVSNFLAGSTCSFNNAVLCLWADFGLTPSRRGADTIVFLCSAVDGSITAEAVGGSPADLASRGLVRRSAFHELAASGARQNSECWARATASRLLKNCSFNVSMLSNIRPERMSSARRTV